MDKCPWCEYAGRLTFIQPGQKLCDKHNAEAHDFWK